MDNTMNSLVDVPLVGSIVNSLANPDQNQTGLVNGCSTGNCTFPTINGITHSTIGMCSQCIDTTSKLNGTGSPMPDGTGTMSYFVNAALPNGLWLQSNVTEFPVLNASGGSSTSLSQLDSLLSQVEDHSFAAIMPASIFNWTIIALLGSEMNSFLSTGCSIYPCMRHYTSLVDRGEFNETLVSTVPALYDNAGLFWAGINASCVVDGSAYDLTRILPNQIGTLQNGSVFLAFDKENFTLPSQCINKIDTGYVSELQTLLANILTGSCTASGFPSCSSQWWLRSLWNSGNATFDTVQSSFNSIVQSITNRMRIQGYDPRTNSTGLVYGTVNHTTTCIAFSWKWMLFPALLIILTVICLAITMAQPIYGVENPLWKSSILPLLYASPGTQLMASGEACDMKAKSKITVARLEKSENKWSFIDKSGERR